MRGSVVRANSLQVMGYFRLEPVPPDKSRAHSVSENTHSTAMRLDETPGLGCYGVQISLGRHLQWALLSASTQIFLRRGMISFCPRSKRTRNTRTQAQSCQQGASNTVREAPSLRLFKKRYVGYSLLYSRPFSNHSESDGAYYFLKESSRKNSSIHIL